MTRSKVDAPLRSLAVCFLVTWGTWGLATARTAEAPPGVGGVWEEVQRLYENAKEAGETVPKDVVDWVKQDFSRIGAWEYRVAEMHSTEADAIEERLNELGLERWECIRVETRGVKTRLYFKRPWKSYLKHVPLSDLLKILPRGDGGAGESSP